MRKNKKYAIILVLIFVAYMAIKYLSLSYYSTYGNRIIKINVSGEVFQAERVSSGEKLAKGLGKRKNLCESCGMFFEFQKSGKHSFWMKDMEIPLDIIWILERKIVHIEKNVQADFGGILTPESDADAVLEINSGKADDLDIKIGDAIIF